MSRYARNTDVSVERSRGEIERILHRYGAEQFGYSITNNKAIIAFKANDRVLRFELPLPDPKSPEFNRTPTGRPIRNPDAALRAWEQACRQRWRALALLIKAKLESIESHITTFEEEFLAHIVLPGEGKTLAQILVPKLADIYLGKSMPKLLEA